MALWLLMALHLLFEIAELIKVKVMQNLQKLSFDIESNESAN